MRHLVKIPLAGLSLFLFLVALLLYLYFFTSVPEQQLNDWLAYYIPQKTGYTVSVDKVYRDIWKRLRLEGIKIYHGSGENKVPFGYIGLIEAQYSISDILSREYHFRDLNITDVDISLVPDERVTSRQKDDGKSDEVMKFPDMIVDNIEIQNINVQALYRGDVIDFKVPHISGSFGSDGEMVNVQIDDFSCNCPQKDFAIEHFTVSCFRTGDEWMVESLNLKTPRSKAKISGKYGKLTDPDFRLAFDVSPLDLEDIRVMAGVKVSGMFEAKGHIDGNYMNFNGQVQGSGVLFKKPLDNFTADYRFDEGKLFIDSYVGELFESPLVGAGYADFIVRPEIYEFEGNVRDLNLEKIDVGLYSSFTGDFKLSGRGFSEKDFHMEVEAELSNADIDLYHFDGAKGKVDFDLRKINFYPGFKAFYKHTVVALDGDLEYFGDLDLDGTARFDSLGDFTGQFFVQDLDGVGQAEFQLSGPTEDFTIVGSFASDSCRLYGLQADSFAFDLNLKSFISHKVGRVEGRWYGGDIYTIPVDSGYFSTVVSGEKYFLDSVRVENSRSKLDFAGSYDSTILPPLLKIDTLQMVLWNDTVYAETPMLMDVYEKEVEFRDFRLNSKVGSLDMVGVITFDEQMDVNIRADNLAINPIASYFTSEYKIDARLSGDIQVEGTFIKPEFVADIWVNDLTIDDHLLGLLNVRATYKDEELTFMPAEIENPHALYTLTGTLPINLSFYAENDLFPPEQMNLKLLATGDALTLVPIVIPSIRHYDSKFGVDFDIAGTVTKPSIKGDFFFTDGTIHTMELVEPLRDVHIGGRVVNDKIYIDTVSAYARVTKSNLSTTYQKYLRTSKEDDANKGLITGFGTVTLLDINSQLYDLTLTGYDCEFYTDAYDARFQTDLFVTVAGESPPLVSGWANVKRFELRERFSKFVDDTDFELAVLEDTTLWDIKLDVHATDKVFIKNAESLIETEGAADMELGGDITVTRENGILGVLGELEVIGDRGNFYLANMKFRIEEGTMAFDNPDTLDPSVNFDVTTRVYSTGENAGYTDLDLLISGRLSNVKIGTGEGSSYSDEDILFVLAENMVASGEGGENITNNLAFLSGRLVSSLLDDIEVVDMVDISSEQPDNTDDTKNPTRLTVWKYISPKLLLSYSQRVSQEDPGRTVGFEYIHNDNISFEGRQGTGDEGVSFDLNLKYEF